MSNKLSLITNRNSQLTSERLISNDDCIVTSEHEFISDGFRLVICDGLQKQQMFSSKLQKISIYFTACNYATDEIVYQPQ